MKKTIETIERKWFSQKCPICKKDIKGFSESQVIYNLEVHTRQRHSK